ncbi:response regulator [Ktedonobacter racemifer]|nr:response regulator [Ktedonobacter racemifer]
MRILVIDDSPLIRKILETCLQRAGHQVMSYPDGVEAMRQLLSPQALLPELIFLDIDLPKLNGYEIARKFKAKPALAAIPIVMISRHAGIMDRLKARLAGAKSFLAKPFTTQQILEEVTNVASPNNTPAGAPTENR